MEELTKIVASSGEEVIDYYEFLQISPSAELETIRRIYRFHATRYHPDNPVTGDPEKFLLVQRAFAVLSDPSQRAEYDKTRERKEALATPMSASTDFLDGIEGEINRRLALLSLLYNKRRTNSESPHLSLTEVEVRMGIPRDYLNFTTWYLKGKNYITKSDNSDFELTPLGVDYIESNCSSIPALNRMVNGGAAISRSSEALVIASPGDAIKQVGPAGEG